MAMYDFKILDRAKKKRILKLLEKYRIEKLDYMLLQTNSKLRIFSGSLSKNELLDLLRKINVDNLGLYFASVEEDIRINIDALHLLSHQIKHNVLEIPDEQAEKWFRGNELSVNNVSNAKNFKEGFVILKNKEDFIGVGKLSKTKILNFMPKERRIK